jgi:DNA-binding CsgD family transcriptional regulator
MATNEASDAPPDSALGGLVSRAAEQLYAQVAATTGLLVGTGPDGFDPESDAARELLETEIAYRGPLNYNRARVVSETTALQLLLARQHQEIAGDYHAILEGWARLASMLSPSTAIPGGTEHDPGSLVEIVTNPQRLAQLRAELVQGDTEEICRAVRSSAADTPWDPIWSASDPGASWRTVVDGQFAVSPSWSQALNSAAEAGAQIRVRRSVSLDLVWVDGRIAVISLPAAARPESLLVRSPHFLALLKDWFELVWNDSTTVTVGNRGQTSLPAAQLQVLRLLAAGMTDDAIAEAAGMTVRTVRRHVSQLYDALGVQGRFAAGAAAVKRGWI